MESRAHPKSHSVWSLHREKVGGEQGVWFGLVWRWALNHANSPSQELKTGKLGVSL